MTTSPDPLSRHSSRGSADSQKARIFKICAELFAAHGFDSVGVAELCEAVGLGRGAFYYHVESKEKILFEISKGYMEQLNEEAREISSRDLAADELIAELSKGFMRTLYENKSEMTVCFRELHLLGPEYQKIVRNLHRDYNDIWRDVIAKGVEDKIFRPIDSIDLKALLGMYFYSFLWIRPQGSVSASKAARHFARLVLDAIKLRSVE